MTDTHKQDRYGVVLTPRGFVVVDSADPCGYGVYVSEYFHARFKAQAVAYRMNQSTKENR